MQNTKKRTEHGYLAAILATAAALLAGCGKPAAAPGDHAGHDHASHDRAAGEEAAHGDACGGAACGTVSLEERAQARCEHDVAIVDCDACRFEAGIVRLDNGLVRGADGRGVVSTQQVAKARMGTVLAVTAEVALDENSTVHISPAVSGIITAVAADMGGRVKAGDPLFTVQSVELGKAVVEYERNLKLTELAARNLAREKSLVEKKVGAEQDMVAAAMAHEEHRAELQASEQALRLLGIDPADRGPDAAAGRLVVRSPADGTIIEKHAVAGEAAEPGQDVMLLADLRTVWVWASVHSRDLAALLAAEPRGVKVDVRVAAFPDRLFTGALTYVGATMDEATRTVRVRAAVANPDGLLRPGMFCEAHLTLGSDSRDEVIAVPAAAVLEDEGRTFVFRHWRGDLFAAQDVKVGRGQADQVEILEGLAAGDTIVKDGAFLLKSDVLREKMGAGCAD